MKYIQITIFILALTMAAAPAFASSASLGLAGNYNAFIFHDFNSSYTDTQGRLAIGGDATLAGYGVGTGLAAGTAGDTLAVNGNLTTYNGGQLYQGDARIGGTTTSTNGGFTVAKGSLYTNASTPINFDTAKTQYANMATSLSGLAATGTVRNDYGGLKLIGNDSNATQVISLDGSALSSGNWGLDILSGISSSDTVVVNVSGTDVTWGISSVGSTLRAHAGNVLFNFYEATSLSILGEAFGSFLAPDADVTGTWGQFNGVLIAGSFDGHTQFHNVGFTGDLPAATPIPGSIFLLGTGMLGLLGWRKRR